MESSTGEKTGLQEDEVFTVHMAVVTANLGKNLFVEEGSLLSSVLQSLLVGPTICFEGRTEEEANCEIFKIKNWEMLEEIVMDCIDDQKINNTAGNQNDNETAATAFNWMAPFLKQQSGKNRKHSNNTIITQCRNTVSVSSKGCMILRLSWDSPVRWTRQVAADAHKACMLIAALVCECS